MTLTFSFSSSVNWKNRRRSWQKKMKITTKKTWLAVLPDSSGKTRWKIATRWVLGSHFSLLPVELCEAWKGRSNLRCMTWWALSLATTLTPTVTLDKPHDFQSFPFLLDPITSAYLLRIVGQILTLDGHDSTQLTSKSAVDVKCKLRLEYLALRNQSYAWELIYIVIAYGVLLYAGLCVGAWSSD